MKRLTVIFLLFIMTFIQSAFADDMSQVPGILSAPVVLYDEGSNLLPDGEYNLIVTFSDSLGTTLFSEQHIAVVRNGVSFLTLGSGYAIDSNFSSSSGGLTVDVFNVSSDIVVEILVEGQSKPQELAVLTSQPYAFISEMALSVAEDSITTSKIKDGSIHEEDLDESLVEMIQEGSSIKIDQGEGDIDLNASHIQVSPSIGLNNATGSTVEKVLQGLDDSIDMLRGTDLGSHEAKSSGVHGVTGSVVGTTDTQSLQNKSIDSTNSINAVAIKSGSLSDSVIPASITRDTELDAVESKVDQTIIDLIAYNISLSQNQSDVASLDDRVSAIEPYTAVAFGKMYDTGSGSGQTMWCAGGRNITTSGSSTGTCSFTSSLNSSDYQVVWGIQKHGCSLGYTMICEIENKTASQFSYDCFCHGAFRQSISQFEASFVVYE